MKKPLTRPATLTSRYLRGRNSRLVEQEESREDLGFGAHADDSHVRLINRNGSLTIRHVHKSFWDWLNLYNRLITMRWLPFLGSILLIYIVANCFFATLYVLAGTDHLKGDADQSFYGPFWKAFFFSAQTLTTVGYGHIAPGNFLTSIIAAFESMIGLLAFALATGLLYGRFSRPKAHVRFSTYAVFAPYLDVNAWMFRMINSRSNQLIDVEVEVSLTRLAFRADATPYRRYDRLNFERNKVAFFPANWTLVHPITTDSPLHGCTSEELAATDAEFLILVRAVDDTFSQMVHSRFSYRYNEVLWGYKFKPMYDSSQSGGITIDLHRLDDVEAAELNP